MALVPHKVVALNELNEGEKNTIAGAVVSLFDTEGNAVTLFDDESGANGSTAKQTDSEGVVVVYVTPGEYDEQVNGGIQRRVLVGNKEITTEQLIERIRKSREGDVITTTGFSVAGDAGGAQWKATSATGLTPSQKPSDRGAAELVDGSGRLWVFAGETINYKQLGADGLGATDDADIIQAVWDSGLTVVGAKGSYRFDSTLTIPNNFVGVFNYDCVHKKNFQGNGITNAGFPNYGSNVYMDGFYLTHESTSTTLRGYMWQMFVDGLRLIKPKIRNISEYQSGAIGCWSLYLSGKGVQVDQPDIDARDAGLFGDGIHFGYLEDAQINGGVVYGGDDALAFFFPPPESAEAGRNQSSKNVSVNGTLVGSKDAHALRIGAASANVEAGNAGNASVWKNLTVNISVADGVLDTSSVTRAIVMNDTRASGDIVDQHDNITVTVKGNLECGTGGLLAVVGNDDITNAANFNNRNYGKVIISCGLANWDNNGAFLRAGGVNELTINGAESTRNFAATFNYIFSSCVGSLIIDNCKLTTGVGGSSGSSWSISNTESVSIVNGSVIDGDGEFNLILYETNASNDSSIFIDQSCTLRGAARLLNKNSAVNYAQQRISGDLYDAGVAKVTANAQGRDAGYIRLADGTVL